MKHIAPTDNDCWIDLASSAIAYEGVVVLHNILSPEEVAAGLAAVERVTQTIRREVGNEQLESARRAGHNEWRLVLAYEPFFLHAIGNVRLLAIVHRVLGEAAVLRFQNVQVDESKEEESPVFNQQKFHQNSTRKGGDGPLSLSVLLPFTPILASRAEFVVALGTHQRTFIPTPDYLEWASESFDVPVGSAVIFDSTLWHRETLNRDRSTRVFLVEEFTRSFIKPHFDYVRALGTDRVRQLPPAIRRLLGWETRLPTSLAEFYLPPDERLYQAGQE
jgi:ectoine hydroxylase-related dioxygenase (phytanoyl-CoA dioxygenase family)